MNLAHLISPESNSGQILSVDGSGRINITPKPTKRIVNIDTWTDAFIMFMDVYCQVHNEQYPDMLKYLHTMRLGAKQYYINDWLSYDEQFRLQTSFCSNMSWDV